MKNVNFIFLVHEEPVLKHYTFVDIDNDHYYYDDYANDNNLKNKSEKCYLPANRLMLDMLENADSNFRVSFAISGIALERFEESAPEVIDSFDALAKTGKVEFLAMPYSYSLSSVFDDNEFRRQVLQQSRKIEQLFGYKPNVLFNTSMIYSDEIGKKASEMGFRTIITEGAKHIMGYKSPHFVYNHPYLSKMKLLIRDNVLSDNFNFRFSQWDWDEYPLTADKFMSWIGKSPDKESVFNIMCGYDILGITNNEHSGIFEFFRALPDYADRNGISFSTPVGTVSQNTPIGTLPVPDPISWTNNDKSLTAYCGNELQNEALNKLYAMSKKVHVFPDSLLQADWLRLQDVSHFYFMDSHLYTSEGNRMGTHYESEYNAFVNYMNVLSDFIGRVEAQFPKSINDEELNPLLQTIEKQNEEIAHLRREVLRLKRIVSADRKSTKNLP